MLSIAERDYVTSNRAIGASSWRTLFLHIFPNSYSPLIVHATFSLSGVILVESSLSFLGLGAQDSAPTWGALLSQGRAYLTEAPHLSLIPGLAIMITIMALNFLGEALKDLLDPHEIQN